MSGCLRSVSDHLAQVSTLAEIIEIAGGRVIHAKALD